MKTQQTTSPQLNNVVDLIEQMIDLKINMLDDKEYADHASYRLHSDKFKRCKKTLAIILDYNRSVASD